MGRMSSTCSLTRACAHFWCKCQTKNAGDLSVPANIIPGPASSFKYEKSSLKAVWICLTVKNKQGPSAGGSDSDGAAGSLCSNSLIRQSRKLFSCLELQPACLHPWQSRFWNEIKDMEQNASIWYLPFFRVSDVVSWHFDHWFPMSSSIPFCFCSSRCSSWETSTSPAGLLAPTTRFLASPNRRKKSLRFPRCPWREMHVPGGTQRNRTAEVNEQTFRQAVPVTFAPFVQDIRWKLLKEGAARQDLKNLRSTIRSGSNKPSGRCMKKNERGVVTQQIDQGNREKVTEEQRGKQTLLIESLLFTGDEQIFCSWTISQTQDTAKHHLEKAVSTDRFGQNPIKMSTDWNSIAELDRGTNKNNSLKGLNLVFAAFLSRWRNWPFVSSSSSSAK